MMIWLKLLFFLVVQPSCELPAEYLSTASAEFDLYSAAIVELDVTDAASLGNFYVELSTVRQNYEDLTPDMPECGLRLHTSLITALANMGDTVALALATNADPENIDFYLVELERLSARLVDVSAAVQTEITRLSLPPTIATRYVTAENLNVRTGPGAGFEAIEVLPRGSRMEVVALDIDADQNVWYEIFLDDGSRGWVFGGFTSTDPP